jgi:hypothetical protein
MTRDSESAAAPCDSWMIASVKRRYHQFGQPVRRQAHFTETGLGQNAHSSRNRNKTFCVESVGMLVPLSFRNAGAIQSSGLPNQRYPEIRSCGAYDRIGRSSQSLASCLRSVYLQDIRSDVDDALIICKPGFLKREFRLLKA